MTKMNLSHLRKDHEGNFTSPLKGKILNVKYGVKTDQQTVKLTIRRIQNERERPKK